MRTTEIITFMSNKKIIKLFVTFYHWQIFLIYIQILPFREGYIYLIKASNSLTVAKKS